MCRISAWIESVEPLDRCKALFIKMTKQWNWEKRERGMEKATHIAILWFLALCVNFCFFYHLLFDALERLECVRHCFISHLFTQCVRSAHLNHKCTKCTRSSWWPKTFCNHRNGIVLDFLNSFQILLLFGFRAPKRTQQNAWPMTIYYYFHRLLCVRATTMNAFRSTHNGCWHRWWVAMMILLATSCLCPLFEKGQYVYCIFSFSILYPSFVHSNAIFSSSIHLLLPFAWFLFSVTSDRATHKCPFDAFQQEFCSIIIHPLPRCNAINEQIIVSDHSKRLAKVVSHHWRVGERERKRRHLKILMSDNSLLSFTEIPSEALCATHQPNESGISFRQTNFNERLGSACSWRPKRYASSVHWQCFERGDKDEDAQQECPKYTQPKWSIMPLLAAQNARNIVLDSFSSPPKPPMPVQQFRRHSMPVINQWRFFSVPFSAARLKSHIIFVHKL